jgi:type IV pilus assembly protein PilN
MIRINLLPHREEKRKRNKQAFFTLLILFGMLGAVVVLAVGAINATKISIQEDRNRLLETENKALDDKIKEIATLKQDIEALKARQQAVEDLQGDRNQPVYLMDELVKQTPEGVYFRSVKQEGQRALITGYAQSSEWVSQMLRNFSTNSPWLEKPNVIEIRSATIGSGKTAKSVFDFTVDVAIKRPRDKDKPTEAPGGKGKSTERGAGAASAASSAAGSSGAVAATPSAVASAVASANAKAGKP